MNPDQSAITTVETELVTYRAIGRVEKRDQYDGLSKKPGDVVLDKLTLAQYLSESAMQTLAVNYGMGYCDFFNANELEWQKVTVKTITIIEPC